GVAGWPGMNSLADLERRRLMVEDVDVRPDGDGWDPYRAFQAKLGHPLRRTWCVQTGSKGQQFYRWVPAGPYPRLVQNLYKLGLGKHVDIKAQAGLVVGAGCFNIAGQYRVLGGEDGPDITDPDIPADERNGPDVADADEIALLSRTSAIPDLTDGEVSPVAHTVVGHVVVRLGLVRPGGLTRTGHMPVVCPWS